MIKLEMELSDIDYEVLVKEILPKVADRLKQNGRPARAAPLRRHGGKRSAARLSTACATAWPRRSSTPPRRALTGTLEKLAADNGIPCKVQGLRATAAQKK